MYVGAGIRRRRIHACCPSNHFIRSPHPYDPDTVTFADLLDYVFQNHDPNRQTRKTQYQNIVFAATPAQRDALDAYLEANSLDPDEIETRIERLSRFYPAEDYHQKHSLRTTISPGRRVRSSTAVQTRSTRQMTAARSRQRTVPDCPMASRFGPPLRTASRDHLRQTRQASGPRTNPIRRRSPNGPRNEWLPERRHG